VTSSPPAAANRGAGICERRGEGTAVPS